MNAVLVAVGCSVVAAFACVFSEMVREEIRGWIDVLPGVVLKMAARQLDPGQRVPVYSEEWLPELVFITRAASGRPLTMFISGMRFSLGLLISGRRVARHLRRAERREPARIAAARRALITVGAAIAELAVAFMDLRDVYWIVFSTSCICPGGIVGGW